MCELFAISSEKPVNLRFSLDRLARRGGREAQNCDGWGLAAYEDCDVYLVREPHPASNSPLMQCMQQAMPPACLLISHLRQATLGERRLCNTQPFVRILGGRKQVFAHNGDLPALYEAPPTVGRWRPVGDTDSERAMTRLMVRLEPLWSFEKPPALQQRLAAVAEFAAEIRPLGTANFAHCDGEYLFIHGHLRTQPDGEIRPGMHMLRRDDSGCGEFDGAGINAKCPGGNVLLFASIPLTDGPWQPLTEGEVLAVKDGEVVARQGAGR